jgi:Ser/Thr protein kinase RdoA (MazF antagonist)
MHSPVTLQNICNFFSVGEIVDSVYLGNWGNHNYFIDTQNGSFVLKIIAAQAGILERVQSEISYITYLIEHDIEVPPYYCNTQGECLYAYDNVYALLRPKIDGLILSKVQVGTEHLFKIGSRLAQLHSCPVPTVLPPRRCWLSEDAVLDARRQIREQYPASAFPLVEHPVLETDWSTYPATIIHGDCWYSNILVSPSNQVTLIDWEEVSINPAVLDIGRTLYSLIEANMIDADSYQAFISGYEGRRKLSWEEKQHIAQSMKYTAITTLLWRQVRFFNTTTPYDIEQSAWYTKNLEKWQPPQADTQLHQTSKSG